MFQCSSTVPSTILAPSVLSSTPISSPVWSCRAAVSGAQCSQVYMKGASLSPITSFARLIALARVVPFWGCTASVFLSPGQRRGCSPCSPCSPRRLRPDRRNDEKTARVFAKTTFNTIVYNKSTVYCAKLTHLHRFWRVDTPYPTVPTAAPRYRARVQYTRHNESRALGKERDLR